MAKDSYHFNGTVTVQYATGQTFTFPGGMTIAFPKIGSPAHGGTWDIAYRHKLGLIGEVEARGKIAECRTFRRLRAPKERQR